MTGAGVRAGLDTATSAKASLSLHPLLPTGRHANMARFASRLTTAHSDITTDTAVIYAAYYVDNLTTGASHQIGIVGGEVAYAMIRSSADARRLVFQKWADNV